MELERARGLVKKLIELCKTGAGLEGLSLVSFAEYCRAVSRVSAAINPEDSEDLKYLSDVFILYHGHGSIDDKAERSDEMRSFIINIPEDITQDTDVVLSFVTDNGPSYIYGLKCRHINADPNRIHIPHYFGNSMSIKMGDMRVVQNRTLEIRVTDPAQELIYLVKDHEPNGIYALHDKAVDRFRSKGWYSAELESPWDELPFMEVLNAFKTYFETPLAKHDGAKEIFQGSFLQSVAAAVVIADPRYSHTKCEYRGHRGEAERYLVCGHESEINNNFKTLFHLEDFLRNIRFAEDFSDKRITINLVDQEGSVEGTVVNLTLNDLALSPYFLSVRGNILSGTGIPKNLHLKDFRKFTVSDDRVLLIFRKTKD